MNAADILKYGHGTFMHSLDGVAQSEWATGGVCGGWSVKDIIGHIGYSEVMLAEVLAKILDPNADTPLVKQYSKLGAYKMNDVQADLRKDWTNQQVLDEYTDAYNQVAELAAQIPTETWRQVGTIPWYGPGYSLDDFVVYAYYGHKREHSAQVDVFKDSFPS